MPRAVGLDLRAEAATLAAAIAVTGGMVIFSDDVPVRTGPLVRVLGSASPAIAGNGLLEAELGAHASVIVHLPAAPPLAVFCDFDGAFAVQDVGSTLAKRYAAERRPAPARGDPSELAKTPILGREAETQSTSIFETSGTCSSRERADSR
jgi:hypothetical protein